MGPCVHILRCVTRDRAQRPARNLPVLRDLLSPPSMSATSRAAPLTLSETLDVRRFWLQNYPSKG